MKKFLIALLSQEAIAVEIGREVGHEHLKDRHRIGIACNAHIEGSQFEQIQRLLGSKRDGTLYVIKRLLKHTAGSLRLLT